MTRPGPVSGRGFGRLFGPPLVAALGLAQPGQAEERFWVLWERYHHVGSNCPDGAGCRLKRSFSSRQLHSARPASLYRLFGVLDPHAPATIAPSRNPDAPRICDAEDTAITLGFDPLALPKSIKIEALRGVEAVFVDLRSLRAPPGFPDSFGADLHGRFVTRLEQGGMRVVDEEALANLPGQPRLNLYFSFTDPQGACDYTYSVFSSLTQEVLLARDLRIKISAGVWSYSTGSTAKDHRGNEPDAILRVAEALLRDHRAVNPRH